MPVPYLSFPAVARVLSVPITAFLLASGPTMAETPTADMDWSAALMADAQAFHDLQSENHPGPVNPLDPSFTERMDAALGLAMERATTVTSAAGYFYALQEFASSLDDGHVGVLTDTTILPPPLWPGFTAFLRDGKMHVAVSRADGPPVGAILVDCDGKTTDALLESNLAPFRGRWMLAAQRERFGVELFVDWSNPWITRMTSCRFETADGVKDWVLNWQPAPDDFRETIAAANSVFVTPTEARPFGDGLWLSAGSFNGQAGEAGTEALEALVNGIPSARTAPVVVLDVRGNGGGNSEWGDRLARQVWGDDAVDAAFAYLGANIQVSWRASAGNLAGVEEQCAPYLGSDDPALQEIAGYCQQAIDEFKAMVENGGGLWIQPSMSAGGPADKPAADPSRRIYFLASGSCASACLDTADLWTALGAIPIGRETNADTFYIENRWEGLPSGLTQAMIPMKVYAGRLRGSNEPVTPVHVFDGDMADTQAIEAWIATLN